MLLPFKMRFRSYFQLEILPIMYQEFFGFTELPFSIAPDPRFLFLGPRHQEALAHLRHGLTSSGGFLLLTGEVGTGKTTLSRAIISELEAELDVVFILNPKLSELELLAAIAEGFGITKVNERSSLKALTDALSQYLMAAAGKQKHPVVLIDEAQHLFPAALEQLRLLTNLESDARKLLSVVLIGQPELRELLQRQELRQVAQRIVARYQLLPFTQQETEHYINHRLALANGSPEMFDKKARHIIWQNTQGTPRLINLLCDRALQIAAREEQQVVNRNIMTAATSALPYANENKTKSSLSLMLPWLFIVVLVTVVAMFVWRSYGFNEQQASEGSHNISSLPRVEKTKQVIGLPLNQSLIALAEAWQLGNLGLGLQPCERLARYNLLCVKGDVTLADIGGLNIPVIGELNDGNTILIRSKEQEQWLVEDAHGLLQLSSSELATMLSGNVLLVINTPPFVNQANNANWHTWVQQRLAALVPYSLQQAPLKQQREWLLDVTLGLSTDDAWLLASLAAAFEYKGPSFSDYQVSNYPSTRAIAVPEAVPEQVTYGSPSINSLTELEPAPFRFIWPANNIEPASRAELNNNPEQEPQSTAAETTEEPRPSANLQALFDEAVRATPAVEPNRNWSFDVESPNPARPASTRAFSASQGVIALKELSSEQREKIPNLSYEQHIYQSSPTERWIGLGSNRLYEGESLGVLKVISIQPNYSILSVGDLLFKVEALEDL